ncbi:efflux RND transporter periplasmic adaptor subunit [Arachidicoccus sp.]|uniref:efflux RND transporter periplasmic adaptor subunit n=1 Tax=Arachidicoccus sp. TaxID=1872624 RepID=UPI003D22353A
MKKYKNEYLLGLIAISMIAISGCISKSSANQTSSMPPPILPVLALQSENVHTYKEFTASLEGSKDIELRPQVSGILTNIFVDEGAYVHKGQVLFKIDSRPYNEQKKSAYADLLASKAALQSAKINVDRLLPLVKNNVVSTVQLQSAQAQYAQAKANVAVAQAAVSSADINVGFTTIEAPADGYIGRIPYKTGSLVGINSPQALTVLSQTKQIYVYFSMSEIDFLHFSSSVQGNTLAEKIAHIPPVTLLLADDSVYPQKGKVEIVEGQFDKNMGAISFRAVFPNSNGLLRSGNTGRIRIAGQAVDGTIVPQEATFEIQNKTYVFVVDDSDKVASKQIDIAENSGNYYVVTNGVKPKDKIVYAGFERLSDGTVIQPRQISMDSLLKVSPVQ